MIYLNQKGLITNENNLDELNKYLDIIFILNKLSIQHTCLSLVDFSVTLNYNFNILKDLRDLLDNPEYADHPLIRADTISAYLLKTNDQVYYLKLIDLLDNKGSYLPQKDLKAYYVSACNFCSKKIKKGYETYYQNMFELYQRMDKNDLIKDNNFIPMGTLKNVTTIACKVKEFNWATQMIEKYKPFVNKEYKFSVYHFNSGAVAFYQNDHKKALSHFIKVDKVNLAYDIDCRMMILKCHYELDTEYDEASMRRFVMAERYIQAHKELTRIDKKAYKNFIRFLLNTYRIKHKATRMKLESITNKIEKAEFISDKKWLVEKIEILNHKKL